jgi:hypothetical protein
MIFILIWIVCAIYSIGTNFAHVQGKYPRFADEDWEKNLGISILFGLLFGPVSVFISLIRSGYNEYGWGPWIIQPRKAGDAQRVRRTNT